MDSEKPKFTPGPWAVKTDPAIPADRGLAVETPEGFILVRTRRAPNFATLLDDANLIAAAPDLYARLEIRARECECAYDPTERCEECKADLAALAKARGET